MTISTTITDPIMNAREGFGRDATGGRDGTLYIVTSLADDGSPGTLRHAVESPDSLWIRFDGLSGDINMTDKMRFGGGSKTIDGRDANIRLVSDPNNISNGGLYLDQNDNFIITNISFDGSTGKNWKVDQEGHDLIHLGSALDVFIYKCAFTHPPDGAIDANPSVPEYAERITILQCLFVECNQVINLTANDVTFARNVGDNVLRRFPQIINGACHAYNNYMYNWNRNIIHSAKIVSSRPNPNFAYLLAEWNLYRKGSVSSVGYTKDGGKCRVENPIKLNGGLSLKTNAIPQTFIDAARALANIETPSGVAEKDALLARVLVEAGPSA